MTQHSLKTPYMVGNVHIYTAETENGTALFDAGAKTDWVADYMHREIDLKNLRYVFITHAHVDHCGMLSFIEQNSDAEIFISKYDKVIFDAPYSRYALLTDILLDSGFPADMVERSLKLFDFTEMMPKKYSIVEENEKRLGDMGLTFMRCPGHSQSDIVYMYDGCAVTGDILLEGIVTVPLLDVDFDTFGGRFDSYRAYCDTFKIITGLTGYRLMPGHREKIASTADCIAFYVGKMADRAQKLKDRLNRESIYSIVSSLIPDAENNPISSYIKASEIFFLKDMINDPSKIISMAKATGTYAELSPKLDNLFTLK